MVEPEAVFGKAYSSCLERRMKLETSISMFSEKNYVAYLYKDRPVRRVTTIDIVRRGLSKAEITS